MRDKQKAKLGNTEISGLVSNMMNDKLSTYLEENPATARAIFDKALAASRAREAARKAKIWFDVNLLWNPQRFRENWQIANQKSGRI